jgi:cobalt-zinc-cadmium efflux system protein
VLLQGAPQALNPDGVARDLEQVPGVRDVHHLHVWSMTGEAPVVTLHAIIDSVADPQAVLQGILGRLRHRHAITHATIQLESIECLDGHEHGCHRA